MLDQLAKNILATICYYDGLEYPLTSFELWKYLIRTDYYETNNQPLSISLSAVIEKLQTPEITNLIEQYHGFYFLKGKKKLVSQRIMANKISAGKLKRLNEMVKIIRYVPYIRMVAITGRLAMKNAHPKSDWDLLIVTQFGKIWTGRTLVTFLLHFLGKRRWANKVKDRACLNFFVTDQSLEVITKDLFSANEYTFLFPVYGWPTFLRFQMKNQWIRNMKPTYDLSQVSPFKIVPDTILSANIKKMGEKILTWKFIENYLKKIEKKRIMQNPKTHQEGSLIYANDDALVFLPSPHGPKFFEQFKEKIQQLNI